MPSWQTYQKETMKKPLKATTRKQPVKPNELERSYQAFRATLNVQRPEILQCVERHYKGVK